jgi:aryl-alcohol dehydrogenase-like predicted oxidoreductase
MIWSPLAGGFLTGKYRRDTPSPDNGRRTRFQMPPVDLELGYRVIDALDRMTRTRDATIAQLALAWMLARPWVSSILIGASRLDQLEENLGAIDVTLSAEELAELNGLTRLKALYPNPRWLSENAPDDVRNAIGRGPR